MPDPVIYKGSPLANYLEDVGLHQADWGVDPDLPILNRPSHVSNVVSSTTNKLHSFAPSLTSRIFSNRTENNFNINSNNTNNNNTSNNYNNYNYNNNSYTATNNRSGRSSKRSSWMSNGSTNFNLNTNPISPLNNPTSPLRETFDRDSIFIDANMNSQSKEVKEARESRSHAQFLNSRRRNSSFLLSPTATTIPPHSPFSPLAPSSPLRPLRSANASLKKSFRLQNYLKASLDYSIPTAENARFLEQFRYVIITSQLLNETIQGIQPPTLDFGLVNSSTEELLPAQHGSSWLNNQKNLPKRYWVSSGGFVLAIAVFVTWQHRLRSSQQNPPSATSFSGQKILFSIAVPLLIALFLYGYTRRKYSRQLRSRALILITRLVQNCQAFDVAANSTFTLVQEIEIVSRGYRLSSPLPPISKIEQRSQMRRCEKLRNHLSASLTLASTSFTHSSSLLNPYITSEDMEKYQNIYDIDQTDTNIPDQENDGTSLGSLKAAMHRLHTARRDLLCGLLAVNISKYENWEKWNILLQQLRISSDCMKQLTEEINRHLDYSDQMAKQLSESPKSAVKKNQIAKLISLSQSIRTIQAKIRIVQDDASQFSDMSSSESAQIFNCYDSIGRDLEMLMDDYKAGRQTLEALSKSAPGTNHTSEQPSQTSSDWEESLTPNNLPQFEAEVPSLTNGSESVMSPSNDDGTSFTPWSPPQRPIEGGEEVFEYDAQIDDNDELEMKTKKNFYRRSANLIDQEQLKIRDERQNGRRMVLELKDVLGNFHKNRHKRLSQYSQTSYNSQ